MLRLLSLCSGIAGAELGIIAANLHQQIEPVQFVEHNLFCQSKLHRWFPNIPIHSDLETFHGQPGQYDIIVAGIPCQPHSLIGLRTGRKDDRNLWGHVLRIIQETQPIGIILENVPGIRHSDKGSFLREVFRDITTAGYDAEWGTISVAAVGGVHQRKRFFLFAYPQSSRWTYEQLTRLEQKRTNQALSACNNSQLPTWTQTIASLCGETDGLSKWMGKRLVSPKLLPKALEHATKKATRQEVLEPLTALGNAICPQQIAIVWKKLYERITNAK